MANPERGFACIALDNPKCGANVGGVMRAAFVFNAKLVVVSGRRYQTFKRFPTDTMKSYRHVPVLEADDLFNVVPHDCVPVAVDLLVGATPLPRYRHPERAFYIFGAEDATLGKRVIERCRDKIMIPSRRSLNLASCVNVILYDRLAKEIMQ